MEEKPHEEPKTEAPKPTPGPVMDVVPPPTATEAEKPANEAANNPPTAKAEAAKPVEQPKVQKPPKQKRQSSGVGLAIFATVVIVLGLAAMAVYAYIKTKS